MVLIIEQEIKTLLSLGEQVEQRLEFLELKDQVLIEMVKQLMVIWSERVEWHFHYKFGEDGIEKSILNKREWL